MCLTLSRFSFKKLAFTDVVCYKFLTLYNNGALETPYQDVQVRIGETYESDLIKNHFNEIEIGLHSFAELAAAQEKARDYSSDVIVVECVIPKWSWYYKGIFCNYYSYASNKLKYVKIIKN